MPATAGKPDLQTTTVRLPKRLYEEARTVVRLRSTDANSLNDLPVESLSVSRKQIRRKQIDDEFSMMKNDAQYRRESQLIAEQFAANDRETIRSVQKANPQAHPLHPGAMSLLLYSTPTQVPNQQAEGPSLSSAGTQLTTAVASLFASPSLIWLTVTEFIPAR